MSVAYHLSTHTCLHITVNGVQSHQPTNPTAACCASMREGHALFGVWWSDFAEVVAHGQSSLCSTAAGVRTMYLRLCPSLWRKHVLMQILCEYRHRTSSKAAKEQTNTRTHQKTNMQASKETSNQSINQSRHETLPRAKSPQNSTAPESPLPTTATHTLTTFGCRIAGVTTPVTSASTPTLLNPPSPPSA